MALIQWTPALSVGVQQIDQQHLRLIQLINDLDAAMIQGQGREALGAIISDLVRYTQAHFALEESLFQAHLYQDSEVHKAEHRRFTADVLKFKAEFDAGKLGLSLKVMEFLSDWLRQHIMSSDQKYAPFFAQRGLR